MPDESKAAFPFFPVRSRRGRVVHALALTEPHADTPCHKDADGWLVVDERVSCKSCIAAIYLPVDPRTRGRVR